MDHVTARAFVNSWVTAWNAHDLDAVLTHFADNVTFRSPVASSCWAVMGSSAARTR